MSNSSEQVENLTSMFNETLTSVLTYDYLGLFAMILAGLILLLCITMGTLIHFCSLWVFLHRKVKPNSVLPLNMTILELTYCFLCLLNSICFMSGSLIAYTLKVFFSGLHWSVRPLLQICMCLEHYIAVIHPVLFLRYNGIQYRVALAAACWLIALANSLRLMFTEYIFPDEVFFAFFCIAVIITSFCCASVLHALKHPGPGDGNNVKVTENDKANKTKRGKAAENQQKRKAFRIISHVLVSILVCYLPLVVVFLTRLSQISDQVTKYHALNLITCITMLSVLIAPLIRMYNDGRLKPKMWFSKLRELRKEK